MADILKYTEIEVPDMNDSVSRIVLDGNVYNIRFTYNDTFDYWKLSLYDDLMEPIVLGIKIVPNFVLNLMTATRDMPKGTFVAYSRQEEVGRTAFLEGKAAFLYVPLEQ